MAIFHSYVKLPEGTASLEVILFQTFPVGPESRPSGAPVARGIGRSDEHSQLCRLKALEDEVLFGSDTYRSVEIYSSGLVIYIYIL